MRLISIIFFCFIGMNINVIAELTSSACSLLRTTSSITTIVSEMAQIAMHYYQVASPNEIHHREQRSLFNDKSSKGVGIVKASVVEQMVANSFKDVNYTRVVHMILNNNETMAKIQGNINMDAIIYAAMREIDYEKLGSKLYYSAEAEFDLEYFIGSIINITHIDLIYEELITNGTLSPLLIKVLHPNINVQTVQQMIDSIKNFIRQFGIIMNSTQRLEEYLFEKFQKYALIPLEKMIEEVKKENPTTLDQLIEIVLDNLNKAVINQISTTTKKPSKTISSTTIATEEDYPYDDVKLLFYQCSIAIQSIGNIAKTLIESIEELYCTSIWD